MTNHLPDLITRAKFDAILFDLDGVLTATARVHAASWKTMFDEFLQARAAELGEAFKPFETATDYKNYVDGKPRYDGVRSFLTSRNITLPEGTPDSPPEEETVGGLGNRKNLLIKAAIETEGVDVFEGSVDYVRQAQKDGFRIAVVSASKNCLAILQAAKIANLFEFRMDGVAAAEKKIPGKPAPDTFLYAAKHFGVAPKRAVVVEDAISGVQAGRNGKFGLVVGVDRTGDAAKLKQNGADIVVEDLSELLRSR